jgi:hypothetical protein
LWLHKPTKLKLKWTNIKKKRHRFLYCILWLKSTSRSTQDLKAERDKDKNERHNYIISAYSQHSDQVLPIRWFIFGLLAHTDSRKLCPGLSLCS